MNSVSYQITTFIQIFIAFFKYKDKEPNKNTQKDCI